MFACIFLNGGNIYVSNKMMAAKVNKMLGKIFDMSKPSRARALRGMLTTSLGHPSKYQSNGLVVFHTPNMCSIEHCSALISKFQTEIDFEGVCKINWCQGG